MNENDARNRWCFKLHEVIFEADTPACPECSAEGHDSDAKFCKYCGFRL